MEISDEDISSKTDKEELLIYSTCRRVGAYLPSNEGTFMEMSTGAIRTACIVASSVTERFSEEYVFFWFYL